MPEPGLPQTVTPWLAMGVTLLAFLGAVGTAWVKVVRPTIQRAIWTSVEGSVTAAVTASTKALLEHELGANGDDDRLPAEQRGKPLRSLVIGVAGDVAGMKVRLQDGDQRFAEIGSAQARVITAFETHIDHHGAFEAAYDEDRRIRGLPPVEDLAR